MKVNRPVLIGAHMSTAGGLYEAVARGMSIGCTAIQIFTTNNRQWKPRYIPLSHITAFKQAVNQSTIYSITSHASYLINLGSPHIEIQKKSINALIEEINRCATLEIPYIVLHPGSRLHMDEKQCLEQVVHNLDIVLTRAASEPMILLETMAGQGSTICYSFEHLATIRSASKYPHRIGVCLDTCHTFAAGYDFTTPTTYNAFINQIENTIGLNHVKVIHFNDSKKDLGSHVDRHEHIGQGKIGLEAFGFLLNDNKLLHIPKILETPKESLYDDIHNLELLKQLVED